MKIDPVTPDFEKRGGLLPVIVQNNETKEILMLGYANELAWQTTLEKKRATFWSTSRDELWTKGDTSGDYLKMEEIRVDCDEDCLVYLVTPLGGGACHTKNAGGETRKSCFFRSLSMEDGGWTNLDP